ncbi:MAG: dehypoxanthine futalosine cyclase, partial [Desulfovibrionaceae bacterium]|nr:dehypoxanthine futalosine cyclase [Desulfovibrionaceae bacterium]
MNARLSPDAAAALYAKSDVFTLGKMAHEMRLALHPEPVVTYIVDRNINYTNICVSACKFCAFFAPPGSEKGYVLTPRELAAKVTETVALGGSQILLQGGLNPDLALPFYTGLLSFLKALFPDVAVHGFSPPEIAYLAEKSNRSINRIIAELKAAGLDSIPGGGAEILVDAVRQAVSPGKCDAATWLEVMRQAHGLGLRTTATMMFGQGETLIDRIEHLDKLRALQDETGGFTAFIPWTFQPGNTRLDAPEASSCEYLKMLALSRLYLDNVANIQASWVTQGPMIGQLALYFGANDFGSTMI